MSKSRCGRVMVLVAAVILVAWHLAPLEVSAGESDPRLTVLGPESVRMEQDADFWWVAFDLLSTDTVAPLKITEVTVDGRDVFAAVALDKTRLSLVPYAAVPEIQLRRWIELRSLTSKRVLTISEDEEMSELTEVIQRALSKYPCAYVRLETSELPFTIEPGRSYELRVSFSQGSNSAVLETSILARSLPSDPDWSPSDLHIHSTYSDGVFSPLDIQVNLRVMGYRVLYLTDHTDYLQAGTTWDDYVDELEELNIPGADAYLYPGAEMTVIDLYTGAAMGDLLAYGIDNVDNLYNKYWAPQGGINAIIGSGGNAAIAHPFGIPSWVTWPVYEYSGYELMTAGQSSFSESASPMLRWRKELFNLRDRAFPPYQGRFPSARSGSDWHRLTHAGYVCWLRTQYWTDKQSVDEAIALGRTVASRYGGLAYMSISYGGTTSYIGDKRSGLPVGAQLTADITVRAVKSGTYTVRIARPIDGNGNTVTEYTNTRSIAGGSSYTFEDVPLRNQFPAGTWPYYLFVSGPDYIYTSPIYLRN